MPVGYQFLVDALHLGVPSLERPAKVSAVLRVQSTAEGVLVPAHVAPATEAPIDHLLFALKHEGTHLSVIAAALRKIEPEQLLMSLRQTPSGGYIRKACYLFERLTGRELPGVSGQGVPVPLFDPDRYLVGGEPVRDSKWRVDFNGLGTWDMCPTVRRTAQIEAGLRNGVLSRAKSIFENVAPEMVDRALDWAYLNETKGSFAIERETPPADKAQAFVHLLKQAWSNQGMDEERLAALQSVTMSNPLLRAAKYRTEQNHLQAGTPGVPGVRYIPPPPDMVPGLMNGVLAIANGKDAMHPLVRASLASFGFVYAHPFMDGNGRLSRFLMHYVLAQSGELPDRGVLPISAAMKRSEDQYLHALESFSKPSRELWDVRWIDGSKFDYTFQGDKAIYPYWDATEQTEFIFAMAEQSLQKDLLDEVDFLQKFDAVYRRLDRELDLQGGDLANLIRFCQQNNGSISNRRRKQYALTVPEDAFALIESEVGEIFFPPDGQADDQA